MDNTLKQIRKDILCHVYMCAKALALDEDVQYAIAKAKLDRILEACHTLHISFNIVAIYRLILYYRRKYTKNHVKSMIAKINKHIRKNQKYIDKIKHIFGLIHCNIFYDIKFFTVINIHKDSIYKQRIKTIKVVTYFNGNYMLHTAF